MDYTLDSLLQAIWDDYLELAPDANGIHTLFTNSNNGAVVNDHIALRTFNLSSVNLQVLARAFINHGVCRRGGLRFPCPQTGGQTLPAPRPRVTQSIHQ